MKVSNQYGKELKQVGSTIGSTIELDGSCTGEIRGRISCNKAAFNKVMNLLATKGIPID